MDKSSILHDVRTVPLLAAVEVVVGRRSADGEAVAGRVVLILVGHRASRAGETPDVAAAHTNPQNGRQLVSAQRK
jgi:hypothetical protein